MTRRAKKIESCVSALKPLHFVVGETSSFAHGIVSLSGYLHDSRFRVEDVSWSGETVKLKLDRDCWEMFGEERGLLSYLPSADSILTISDVREIEWTFRTKDAAIPIVLRKQRSFLMIEECGLFPQSISGESSPALILYCAYEGWRLKFVLSSSYPRVVLEDRQVKLEYKDRKRLVRNRRVIRRSK